MAIHKTGGAKFYISPTSVNPDTIDAMDNTALLAFYNGISDWEEVEEVENLGEVGDTAENIAFTTVGRNRVRKLKGPRDAGNQTVVVGRDPLDDGQEAMIAAEGTDFNYPFKILMNDARAAGYSQSAQYYIGLVMSRPTSHGPNAQVTTRSFGININSSILEVSSEVLSAPTNTLLPSISGELDETEILTAIEGTWTGYPIFTYQWKRDGVNIGGATARTYTIVNADVGTGLSVAVTGTNTAGSATAESAITADIPA